MENGRRCDVCNVDVHRNSYGKHLRIKKHLEKEKQDRMILPEWLFQDPIENKVKKIYNPKPVRQLAGEIVKLDD